MSTLKTTNLQNASAASPAIVLAADGSATAQLSSLNGGPLAGTRNRIINGDMRIDQRNNGAAVSFTATGPWVVDRWLVDTTGNASFTGQRNAGSVTPPTGFTNYLGYTSTAAYTPGANTTCCPRQAIEGFNCADFAWGTANAQTVTLSFWVRSSLSGTHSGSLSNEAGNRSYVFSYSITAANTWEYKTLVIPGDTSGTWNTSNGYGIGVRFNLGTGTGTFGTTSTGWQAGNLVGLTSAVQVSATNGATFYITGVQLEAGTVATTFERISYSQSLQLCQRYCVKYGGINANEYITPYGLTYVSGGNYVAAVFPVEMRAAPTVTWSTLRWTWQGSAAAITGLAVENASTKVCGLQVSTGGGETQYRPGIITANNSTSAYLIFSAEL